jgi:hypothetical protein
VSHLEGFKEADQRERRGESGDQRNDPYFMGGTEKVVSSHYDSWGGGGGVMVTSDGIVTKTDTYALWKVSVLISLPK